MACGHKEKQARAGGRMYGVSNLHGRVFQKEFLYSYKEVWWTAVGELLVCKRDASDAAVRKQLS